MNRQIEAQECQRCGVESIELEEFVWFDPDSKEWHSGPICVDRKACLGRAAAKVPA